MVTPLSHLRSETGGMKNRPFTCIILNSNITKINMPNLNRKPTWALEQDHLHNPFSQQRTTWLIVHCGDTLLQTHYVIGVKQRARKAKWLLKVLKLASSQTRVGILALLIFRHILYWFSGFFFFLFFCHLKYKRNRRKDNIVYWLYITHLYHIHLAN